MSDSETRQELPEEVREAIAGLEPALAELLTEGQGDLLSGPSTVTLTLLVPQAATPQEAVDLAIRRLTYLGTNRFVWVVTDDLTNEEYFVQGGQVLDEAEVRAMAPNDVRDSLTINELVQQVVSNAEDWNTLPDEDPDEDPDEPPVAPPAEKKAKKKAKKAAKDEQA